MSNGGVRARDRQHFGYRDKVRSRNKDGKVNFVYKNTVASVQLQKVWDKLTRSDSGCGKLVLILWS